MYIPVKWGPQCPLISHGTLFLRLPRPLSSADPSFGLESASLLCLLGVSTWLLHGPLSAGNSSYLLHLASSSWLSSFILASLIPSSPIRAMSQVQFCLATIVLVLLHCHRCVTSGNPHSAGNLGAGSAPKMGSAAPSLAIPRPRKMPLL